MNSECKHPRMIEMPTPNGVKSSCPDCGLEDFAPNEEIAEVTDEVARDILRRAKR